MLTWYYDTPRSYRLDLFDIFDDFSKKPKSKDHVDESGIKIEMPGVTSADLEVTVEGKILKVKGKSRHGKEYSYSYSLNSTVDESKIAASLKDGLLELTLPKRQDNSARKIQVES
jgi:HSP20 family protein